MRIIDLISIPAVALLLAACGGGDDGSGDTEQPATVDPCELVTQADAEGVFGYPASPDQGADVVDPAYVGDCLWTYVWPDNSSLLLAIYVWDNANGLYYSAEEGSEPLDLGDEGFVRVDELTGVDIGWRQNDLAIYLDYFATGPSAPSATDKVEEVKGVAGQASARITE